MALFDKVLLHKIEQLKKENKKLDDKIGEFINAFPFSTLIWDEDERRIMYMRTLRDEVRKELDSEYKEKIDKLEERVKQLQNDRIYELKRAFMSNPNCGLETANGIIEKEQQITD